MTPPLRVEVSFAADPFTPVWTDVTAYVVSVSTVCGRQDELGRYEAGTATIVLDDGARPGSPAGRFDPHNPTSPYVGALDENRPVRIRLEEPAGVFSPVWQGYADRWTPSGGDDRREVTLEATDGFKLIAARPPQASAFTMEATFPREATFAGSYPQQQGFYRLGVDSAPGAGIAVKNRYKPGVNGSIHNVSGPPIAPFVEAPDVALAAFNGSGTYAALPSGDWGRGSNFSVTFMIQCNPSSVTQRVLTLGASAANYGMAINLEPAYPGLPRVYLRGVSTTGQAINENFVDSPYGVRVDDGKPHLVEIACYYRPGDTTGLIRIQIDRDSTLRSASRVSYLYNYGTTYLGIVPTEATSPFLGYLGDIVFLSGADDLSPFEFSLLDGDAWGPIPSRLTNFGTPSPARPGMTPFNRAFYLLRIAGWPSSFMEIAAGQTAEVMTAVNDPTRNTLDQLRAAADVEDGAIHMTPDGKVRYATPTSRPAAVSATFGPDNIPYDDIDVEQLPVINRVTLTAPGRSPRTVEDTASIARYHIAEHAADLEAGTDTLLDTRAAALLAARKAPATRFRSLSIAPLHSAAALAQVKAARLEQLVRVLYTAPGGAYTLDRTVRIAGWADTYTDRTWRRRYFLEG